MLSSQDSFLNTSSPWKSIKFRMESKRRRNEAPIIRPTNPPHPYSALERPNVSCRETARRYVLPRVTGPIHVHQITSETVDAARARLTGDKFPASSRPSPRGNTKKSIRTSYRTSSLRVLSSNEARGELVGQRRKPVHDPLARKIQRVEEENQEEEGEVCRRRRVGWSSWLAEREKERERVR